MSPPTAIKHPMQQEVNIGLLLTVTPGCQYKSHRVDIDTSSLGPV